MTTLQSSDFTSQGSTLHLILDKVSDLDCVLELDDVHWLASTAPTSDFLLPPVFLQYVDTDEDGRLTTDDIRKAINQLRQASSRTTTSEELSAADLSSDKLAQTWSKIVATFDLAEDTPLTVHVIRGNRKRYLEEPTRWGSGSLAPEDAQDPEERALLEAVQEHVKPEKEAVTDEQFETFLQNAKKIVEWRHASPGDESWASEYPAYRAISQKLEEYFLLADTAQFTGEQPEVSWPERRSERNFSEELEELPLSYPLDPQKLDFQSRINPRYEDELKTFRKVFLSDEEHEFPRERFEQLRDRFHEYADWLEKAPDFNSPELDTSELEKWLESEQLLDELRRQLRDKREHGLVRKDFDELEKILLYQAHLLELCQNFVAFSDLYDPDSRALFERGTLVMDGREFHLVLPVDDIARHKKAATRSNMFVLYLEADGENFAVPVTTGTEGHLAKLKYGVLHHVSGEEKVAKVVDLVSNPISFFEALVAPIKKLGAALKDKIENLSSEKEEALLANSTSVPTKPKGDKPSQGSLLAGGGVAVAALGSSLAFVVKSLAGLTPLKILISFLVLFLAFVIPAGIVAYLKLRNRDLSAVLEGNAWGINGRMKLTSDQAKQFTREPRHPGYAAHVTRLVPTLATISIIVGLIYYFRESLTILFAG